MSLVRFRPAMPIRIQLSDGSEVTITADSGALVTSGDSDGFADVGDRVEFTLAGTVVASKGRRDG